MRGYVFLIAALVLFVVIACSTLYYTRWARRKGAASWQGLISQLSGVSHENVALVALDLIDDEGRIRDREWPELSSEQIWTLMGGMEGLDRLEANCRVLIDIAVYVQQVHPEAVAVAEELRRNTRHIQWHLNRLRGSEKTGNLASSFGEYAQRAVASYYLMTKQVVALCEQTAFPGTEQLRAAV